MHWPADNQLTTIKMLSDVLHHYKLSVTLPGEGPSPFVHSLAPGVGPPPEVHPQARDVTQQPLLAIPMIDDKITVPPRCQSSQQVACISKPLVQFVSYHAWTMPLLPSVYNDATIEHLVLPVLDTTSGTELNHIQSPIAQTLGLQRNLGHIVCHLGTSLARSWHAPIFPWQQMVESTETFPPFGTTCIICKVWQQKYNQNCTVISISGNSICNPSDTSMKRACWNSSRSYSIASCSM